MNILHSVVFGILLAGVESVGYNVRELRCGICQAILREMKDIVGGVRLKKTANIGPHRLDESGNVQSKAIPLVRSETFLTDAMETACRSMENYARGIDKKTGKVRVVKLITQDVVNPEMNEIEAISDSDLNQSLLLHCDDIIDTYEKEILRVFGSDTENYDNLCTLHTDLCATRDSGEL